MYVYEIIYMYVLYIYILLKYEFALNITISIDAHESIRYISLCCMASDGRI